MDEYIKREALLEHIEAPDYSETGYRYPLEVRVGFYGFCSYGERKGGDSNADRDD